MRIGRIVSVNMSNIRNMPKKRSLDATTAVGTRRSSLLDTAALVGEYSDLFDGKIRCRIRAIEDLRKTSDLRIELALHML